MGSRNVDTGRLLKSLHSRIWLRKDMIRAEVGSSVAYARPIHDGSKPHLIRPVRRTGLKFYWPAGVGNPPLTQGRVVCYKGVVHHPGHRSNRYLTIPLMQVAPQLGFQVVIVRTASRFAR